MSRVFWVKTGTALLGMVAAISPWREIARAEEPPEPEAAGVNCSFKSDPDEFLSAQSRGRADIFQRNGRFQRSMAFSGESRTVDAASIPRRNFIDDEIFEKLSRSGVRSARLSSDEEFLRRIALDLTGRIPAPEQIRAFLADTDPGKRDRVIDTLLYSIEFRDKWTMWFGDLLQNNVTASNVNLQVAGRNAFHNWIRASVNADKSIRDMAHEAVTGGGNNYRDEAATSNFYVKARTPGGPAQDTFDTMLFRTASAFLGMAYYDCVLCHDGRGHLDQLSVWGKATTRVDAQRMAAFFSRTRLSNPYQADRSNYLYNSFEVSEAATGQYDLNTNFGNRPNRVAIGGTVRNLMPEYRETGAQAGNGNWRAAFAGNMVKDPMFARNFANRLWKAMFNLGLVDPVDTMDPARLDPNAAPPAGWALQATHPELLERLAAFFVDSNYSLRETLRLIAQSSAYQLSSRYDGEWKLDYVPLFARHYVRRLEGEEVHDAIQKATGVLGRYTIGEWADTVSWAMQFPDTSEPRSNGNIANFINNFIRGNRDTQARNQAGSIQQQLALMNDNTFAGPRLRVSASPALLAVSRITGNDDAVEELFLLFLSRKPSSNELARGAAHLAKAGGNNAARNTAIEDLAWACVNKVDFLFSY